MSESSSPSPRVRSSNWVSGVVLLVVVGIVLAVGGLALRNRAPDPKVSQACELYRLRNEALVLLENEDIRSEAPLSRLAELLPNDPLAVRNLVISRHAALNLKKLPDGTELVGDPPPQWLPPLERLQKLEPEAVSTWMLTAMHHERAGQPQQRLEALRKATEVAPQDPATWFALYMTIKENLDFSDDPDRQAEARKALDTLIELEPRNLRVLVDLARAQAEQQDAEAVKTLETLREVVEPLAENIKRLAQGADPLEYLDRALTAARDEKWPQAAALTRPVENLIKSDEWFQSDLRALQRNHLSYMVFDFLPESLPEGPIACEPEAPVLAVTLTPIASDQAQPDVGDVVAIAIGDFNLDERPDLWMLGDEALRIAVQDGEFGHWAKPARTMVPPGARGLLLADFDRDDGKPRNAAGQAPEPEATKVRAEEGCQPGDLDAVVYGKNGITVLRNEKGETDARSLTAVEQTRGLEAVKDVTTAILVDIDHDGDLDIVLATPAGIGIWAMRDELQFVDISERSELPKDVSATDFAMADWDRDADIDVLYVDGKGALGLLENLRHGAVRHRALTGFLPEGTSFETLRIAELDGNASWDVVAGSVQALGAVTTRTLPAQSVTPLRQYQNDIGAEKGLILWDFDNDGHLDVAAAGSSGLSVLRGRAPDSSNGQVFDVAEKILTASPKDVRALATADLDGDGDLELVAAHADAITIFNNEGGNKNKWLSVRTQGETGDKQGDVNHLGIGSSIEVWSGNRFQAQVVTDPVTHFGLGASEPEALRVLWTNGVTQSAMNPQINQTLCRIHDPKGSCPYLYTWTGERYEFCTDACWGAPLGMRFAESVFAKPRAWEYLTIPGEMLKPKNGRYSMQMTEELWEATYLDKCELLVVDHPIGTRIMSNEKVGPAEIAEHKIHTITNPRTPVAARDQNGRDVLDLVAKEDHRYLRAFDERVSDGVTTEHVLELDLGKLEDPQQITLFLTGWMFPTPTSVNMQLSQDNGVPPVKPPALWVPDEQGQWQEVRPFMGFPGGKRKSIAVDLSDAFLTDDYRLRIVTNMEVYWDAAWFTADDPSAEVRVTKLPVVRADIHYRGFSAISEPDHFGPHQYDYSRVSTALKYPPMGGKFTRFGDVTELLTEEDDRMVVFGQGDEITIEFDVPKEPVREGWTRDFLLYNNGWDKDADLHIIHGQTVEPLPFQNMSGYPFIPDEDYPDTPATREYLQTYQTRTQPRAHFWRRLHQVAQ